MFKNVLVGADSSATALRAVEAAAELAAALGAKLHIVTAYRAVTVNPPEMPPDLFYATTCIRQTSCSRTSPRSRRRRMSRSRSTQPSARRPRRSSRSRLGSALISSSSATKGCEGRGECSAACRTPSRTTRRAPSSSSTRPAEAERSGERSAYARRRGMSLARPRAA